MSRFTPIQGVFLFFIFNLFKNWTGYLKMQYISVLTNIIMKSDFNMLHGNFSRAEYTLTCRLRASSTRSAWRMRTQRRTSPGEIPRARHQRKEKRTPDGVLFSLVTQYVAKSNFINENTVLKSTVQHCGWNYDFSTLPHKIINLAAGITISQPSLHYYCTTKVV